jgi:succinate-semialdehyde dehydrogenase / glutarate-semialdehyde dehydrogenase
MRRTSKRSKNHRGSITTTEERMAYETVNPASGARLKSFDDISETALESAVATAQRAYQTSWRDRPVAERAQILSKAAALLRERADEYAGYVTLEMGKLSGAAKAEVQLSAAILDYYASHAEEFSGRRPSPASPTACSRPARSE